VTKETKEEFEQGYAERSGLTVKEIQDLGLIAFPCDCGDPTCRGWQMQTWESWDMRVRLGLEAPNG